MFITFNVLHGRVLPAATGISLASNELKILAIGGDGDVLAEGGNHLIHAARRNINVTYLMHNNMVYGLTKGQVSPTSDEGLKTPTTPGGNPVAGLNPILMLLGLKASFIAQPFSGSKEQLSSIIERAIQKPGFAFIDILQPCPSFNKVNTRFKKRVYDINEECHRPDNLSEAFQAAMEWGERIPTGIFYDEPEARPVFNEVLFGFQDQPLVEAVLNPLGIKEMIKVHL